MLVDFDEYVKAGFRDDEAFRKVFGDEADAGHSSSSGTTAAR